MFHTRLKAALLAAVVVLPGVAAAQAAQGQAQASQAGSTQARGKTQVTWWGHAAFILRTPGGATLAIDPWLDNPKAPQGAERPTALDAILVTHGHSDHVGNTRELADRTHAQVVGAFELTQLIGARNSAGGNIGGAVRIKDVTIHLVEAAHSSGYSPDQKAPPQYAGHALGFVLQVDNGPTLYHAGDTGFFASMALIAERYRPTHALLPIGGHFTMDPAGAALAARLLKVRTVVPMHFGTFPALSGTPEQLQAELRRARVGARVMTLEPGKTVEL